MIRTVLHRQLISDSIDATGKELSSHQKLYVKNLERWGVLEHFASIMVAVHYKRSKLPEHSAYRSVLSITKTARFRCTELFARIAGMSLKLIEGKIS